MPFFAGWVVELSGWLLVERGTPLQAAWRVKGVGQRDRTRQRRVFFAGNKVGGWLRESPGGLWGGVRGRAIGVVVWWGSKPGFRCLRGVVTPTTRLPCGQQGWVRVTLPASGGVLPVANYLWEPTGEHPKRRRLYRCATHWVAHPNRPGAGGAGARPAEPQPPFRK